MNLPQVHMCSPSWTLLPPSLPTPSLWVVPVHQPQASSIVHRTWTGNSFHTWYFTCFNAILPNLPTLSLSHRVRKTVLYISVSFAVSYTGLLLPSCFSFLPHPLGEFSWLQGSLRRRFFDAYFWCLFICLTIVEIGFPLMKLKSFYKHCIWFIWSRSLFWYLLSFRCHTFLIFLLPHWLFLIYLLWQFLLLSLIF